MSGLGGLPHVRLLVTNAKRRRAAQGTRVLVEGYTVVGSHLPALTPVGHASLAWASSDEATETAAMTVFAGGSRAITLGYLTRVRRDTEGALHFVSERDYRSGEADAWYLRLTLAFGLSIGDDRDKLPPEDDGYVIRLLVGADDGPARTFNVHIDWNGDPELEPEQVLRSALDRLGGRVTLRTGHALDRPPSHGRGSGAMARSGLAVLVPCAVAIGAAPAGSTTATAERTAAGRCLSVPRPIVAALKSGLKAKARGRLGPLGPSGPVLRSPSREGSLRARTSSPRRCAASAWRPGLRTRERSEPAAVSSPASARRTPRLVLGVDLPASTLRAWGLTRARTATPLPAAAFSRPSEGGRWGNTPPNPGVPAAPEPTIHPTSAWLRRSEWPREESNLRPQIRSSGPSPGRPRPTEIILLVRGVSA